MDSSAYRTSKTSRGFNYRYHFASNKEGRPFIVFIHGFPSTSYDWYHQAKFFKEKGYGLIVPDMLGYGGTSIVFDTAAYKHTLLAKDVVDILDAESVEKAIFIGHDWGSMTTSRIVQLYEDRVIAAGFLSVGYSVPDPNFDYETVLAFTKEKVGYEVIGYCDFLASEGADKIIEENWDAFQGLVWPEDPKSWITHFAPKGALKSYLLSGEKLPPASWLTAKDKKMQMQTLLMGGLTGPLCYYKLFVSGLGNEDDASVPVEKYETDKPVFIGTALEDYVSLAAFQKIGLEKYCKNATVRDFKTSHWLQMEAPEEVNKELLAWIEGL